MVSPAPAPRPPYGIEAFPGIISPTTCLTIQFKDDDFSQKQYLVSAQSLIDGHTKTERTNKLFATIRGLAPGCSYMVFVISIRDGLESKRCDFEEIVQTYPDEVEKLTVIDAYATSLSISWKSVFGALSYIVKHRRSDRNYKSEKTQETELTLQNLDIGHNYKICVAAVNSAGTGRYTELEIEMTDLAPPSSLQATTQYLGDDVSIVIEFVPMSQDLLCQYLVELVPQRTGRDPVKIPSKIVKTTRACFDSLPHGACYVPSVCALGSNDVRSVTVHGERMWTRPSQVNEVTNEFVSLNSEKISWKKVNGATSYTLKCREEGKELESTYKTRGTEYDLSNLALNTRFAVRVAAQNTAGTGLFSKSLWFQTALLAPTGVMVANTADCGILVTWEPCTDAKQYNVNLFDANKNDVVQARQISANQRSYKFLDIASGCEYRAMVQAVADDQCRSSAFGHSMSTWTYCSQVQTPHFHKVKNNVIDIKWKKISGAQKYKIVCKSSAGILTKHEVEINQLTLFNLELGETYNVIVIPYNEAGYSKQSDSVTFETAMQPPSNIKVTSNKDDPSRSVKIKFDEPKKKPPTYSISVSATSHREVNNRQPIVTEMNQCLVQNLQPGTEYVACVWSFDQYKKERNSEVIQSEHFWTAPAKVSNVNVDEDSPTSRHIHWAALPSTSSYIVKLKNNGSNPISQEVERNEIHISDLSLHSKYDLTVRAKNAAGSGDESDKISFETALCEPTKVSVSKNKRNPTSALDIIFQQPKIPAEKYRVRVTGLRDGKSFIKEFSHQEALSVMTISDLEAGKNYTVAVSSVHDSYESLNSKETLPIDIQTGMPALAAKSQKLSDSRYEVTWEGKINVIFYKVLWREENENWQEKEITATEYVINDLKPGRNYEVKVVAYGSAGQGHELKAIKLTTAPATPKGLRKEIKSTRTVEISCDEVVGASKYLFRVDDQLYEMVEPRLLLQHDGVKENLTVDVSAKNDAGTSSLSEELHFTQTLLRLQKKFFKMMTANTIEKDKFVAPVIKEVSSGDGKMEIGTENFCIENSETILVVGGHFTGKTAWCCQYGRYLSEDKIGLFLDWDYFKDLTEKVSIKTVLRKCLPDIGDEELTFLFEWMKENSDKVVLIIDNFSLPKTFVPKTISSEWSAEVQHIFFNLVDTNKEFFSKSQVLCTTSQSDLKQIINPRRCLNIVGFDEREIEQMKAIILDLKSNLQIPKHLKDLCKNPSYCEILLTLLKHPNSNTDMESYSSVLIEVLEKSLSRYYGRPNKKIAKLKEILQEIQNVSQMLIRVNHDPKESSRPWIYSSASSSTIGKTRTGSVIGDEIAVDVNQSCANLHDFIVHSFYLAYFCSFKYFENQFQTKAKETRVLANNPKIWIMTAGLLREQTMRLAIQLFEQIGKTLNETEIAKKANFMSEYVRKRFPSFKKYVTDSSQVLVVWCEIANEINDKEGLLKNFALDLEVNESMTKNQIQNIAGFLRCMPRNVCGIFNLALPKKNELTSEKKNIIAEGLRENPYFKEIPADKVETIFEVTRSLTNDSLNKIEEKSVSSVSKGNSGHRISVASSATTLDVFHENTGSTSSLNQQQNDDDTSLHSDEVASSASTSNGLRGNMGSTSSLNQQRNPVYSSLHSVASSASTSDVFHENMGSTSSLNQQQNDDDTSLHSDKVASSASTSDVFPDNTGSTSSMNHHRHGDYSSLHSGEGVNESIPSLPRFAQAATVLPQILGQLQLTHMQLCKAFTVDGTEHDEKNVLVTAKSYCTSERKHVTARIMNHESGGWSEVGIVPIPNSQRFNCNVDTNKTYILCKPLEEDMSGLIFHMMCRTTVEKSMNLTVTISRDDGFSCFEKSQSSSMEQRFALKMKDTVDVTITMGSDVALQWSYTLDVLSLCSEKILQLDKNIGKLEIFCCIRKDGMPISEGRVSVPPTGNETSKETQTAFPPFAQEIPETSLYAELPSTWKPTGALTYVAKSLSTRKEISATLKETFAILEGIDPGDKYSVTIHERVEGSPDLLIAKSEIQTRKTIRSEGGTVVVGGCTLKFPEGAVSGQAAIGVCNNLKDVPCVPDDRLCITPVFDFQSTQKKFDKYVRCTFSTPYINVQEPITVEIICYENYKWQNVCTSVLTKKKTIEFECDHFTPYAAVIGMSFADICGLDMTFQMENIIYCDVHDNFTAVTCLDQPSIINKCDSRLRNRGYFCSPLFPSLFHLKVSEKVNYLLKTTQPESEIGQWEVTFNESFVKTWCNAKTFVMDTPGEGTGYVKLLLKRTHTEGEEEFPAKITYPIQNTTSSKSPVTTAAVVVQGGQATFTYQDSQTNVAHPPET